MQVIKIDYDRAYRQAKALRDVADGCDDSCRQVDIVLQSLDSSWKGMAAKQFETELINWKREQRLIRDELMSIANSIDLVAKEFKAAEERINASISQQISGGGGGR